jgi:phage terminase small subunit
MSANVEGVPPEVQVPALVKALGDKSDAILGPLTARQRRFVEEYLVDLNATQAAIRAGYTPHSAKSQGYENLRKPAIVDAISAVMATRSEATSISRSWVLAQLAHAHNVAKEGKTIGHLTNRLKALELIGRHVDVRAFRAGLGFGGGDEDDGRDVWDLSRLTDEEFEVFERLLAKVTVITTAASRDGGGAGGTGGTGSPEASGAHSSEPGANPGSV